MAFSNIEKTLIWKKTLSEKITDEYKDERENLRVVFKNFRNKTEQLVSRIAAKLPNLTQHDISHLDALWETASLIIGEDYPLNPLEAFVLGGAFLLHDSALCVEAYNNGIEGLQNTVEWKDVYAELIDSNTNKSEEELKHEADFITLRSLHADKAEGLLAHSWNESNASTPFYLLDDVSLRIHLGEWIGKIAASHNWNIERVVSVFKNFVGVPSGYPRNWTINPLKLACILRCADAAHVDNDRAPDFLFALMKRNKISTSHWKAQNNLGKAYIDQKDIDGKTLIFTSNTPFKEEFSNAWFVAYDAICLLDKEIKSCNFVLEQNGDKRFQIEKVKGAESPESLSAFVTADGWKPCSAQVHISNIESMIHNLGGEMLYGKNSDKLSTVIRELIQNSRDSIIARQFDDPEFDGQVTISIQKEENDFWIIVEDDGIGMSERVLTGPLLDFGTSFWTSDLVKSEFPGLRSSKHKPVGKFGIGFYSIFMIAEQVIVSSRNWKRGLVDINQLKFPNGFTLKPILTKEAPKGFHHSISTQVKFKVKEGILSDDLMFEIKTNREDSKNFFVPIEKQISFICAGLDVPVFFKSANKEILEIHKSVHSEKLDRKQWLTDISFADFNCNDKTINEYIESNIDRLKPVFEENKLVGLAAINTRLDDNIQDFLAVNTIGGLSKLESMRSNDHYIGYLDCIPNSAKRDSGEFVASTDTLKKWAIDQLNYLNSIDLLPIEKYVASASLSFFNVDTINFAQVKVRQNNIDRFYSIEQLVKLSLQLPLIFLVRNDYPDIPASYHDILNIKNYIKIIPILSTSYLHTKLENWEPQNEFSLIGCIFRKIKEQGYTPNLRKKEKIGYDVFNRQIDGIVLSSKR
jgi:Histidine kinase-, DNA gyrase B-, and HSP90-like ATPase